VLVLLNGFASLEMGLLVMHILVSSSATHTVCLLLLWPMMSAEVEKARNGVLDRRGFFWALLHQSWALFVPGFKWVKLYLHQPISEPGCTRAKLFVGQTYFRPRFTWAKLNLGQACLGIGFTWAKLYLGQACLG
jgi:hypothetical protein